MFSLSCVVPEETLNRLSGEIKKAGGYIGKSFETSGQEICLCKYQHLGLI